MFGTNAVFTGPFHSDDFNYFRATQYACALSIYLLRNNPEKKDLVVKLKGLEASMSAGRKREYFPIISTFFQVKDSEGINNKPRLHGKLYLLFEYE